MQSGMKVLALGILGAWVCANAGAAGVEVLTQEETTVDGCRRVVLASDRYRLTFEPARGGRCVSFRIKANDREWVPDGKVAGLFLDHFAHQGWPGELLEAPYEYRFEREGDRLSLRLWRMATGGPDGRDAATQGLRVEKTITLRAGRREIEVVNTFHNPTAEGRSVGLWVQQVFCYGGDRLFDLYYRPSSQGICLTGMDDTGGGRFLPGTDSYSQDFVGLSAYDDAGGRKVTAGWTAGRDRRTHEGAVFLIDYNYLGTLYNSASSFTTEWFMDSVPLPAGKSWSTACTIVPVDGFTGFTQAGRRLIANTEAVAEAEAVRISHQFAGGVEPLGALVIETRVRGERTGLETELPPLKVENVGLAPVSATQSWPHPQSEPLRLEVRVRGSDWEERYTSLFDGKFGDTGIDGAGELVEDRIVPPPKQKTFLRPDSWARPANPHPRVLVVYGLYSHHYGLEEAVRALDPEAQITIVEGWKFFPPTHDVLLGYDVIVLSNMEAGPDYANVLVEDVVRFGGVGLLALGGMKSFGGGQWRGTALGNLLPADIRNPFDLKWEKPGAPVTIAGKHPVTSGLEFPADARFYWVHELFPKADATVLLTAGGRPIALAGKAGKGRVLAVAGTCHGEAAEGEREAWRTPAWNRLLTQSLRWLRTGE